MDYKNLFRKIERNMRTIERSSDLLATLAEILRRLVDDFQDDLGLVGGRIYERKGTHYVLKREYPSPRAPKDFKIPATYPEPITLTHRRVFLFRFTQAKFMANEDSMA